MRRFIPIIALLASLPVAAHAATITLTGGGSTYTYTVATSPTPAGYYPSSPSATSAGYFELDGVTTHVGSATTSDTVYFYTTADGGGIEDDTYNLNLIGDQLFTGLVSAPTFVNGVYSLNDGGSTTYTATITGAATAVTPEPSSLALLGTGVLGLAGMARRRFLRS